MIRKRGLLFASVFSLILIVDLTLFGMNSLAFVWHVRHGFHSEVNGIRFWVPLFYQERDSSVMNQFAIDAFSSPVHRRYASITVAFPPWSNGAPLSPLSIADARRIGLVPVRQRTATLGRRTGTCAEYSQMKISLTGHSTSAAPMYIECRLGEELDISFDGSQESVTEFYAFIEAAREVKH